MKRLLFVDDEPRILQGIERQLHKLRSEWEMFFLTSGSQALEFLAQTPVEVIVSDMMMPGMDGAQLLTEVMKRHPGTIRLVLSGHSDREAVLRLVGPAHQYLSKPCDADELRYAIARALTLRALLAQEPLKQLVSRIHYLPSSPALYQKLNEEFSKEEPSIERVAQIVSKDIAVAAKILQLVNSAFFGLPQPAATIEDAVSFLGLSTLRALVLSMEVFSQLNPHRLSSDLANHLADHCWRTGVLARRIAEAEHSPLVLRDQCFLAGLLHDVGYLVLASSLPGQLTRVLETVRLTGRPMLEVEQVHFGATHAEVGGYLLGLWGLPNPVIEAVAMHHHLAAACPASGFSPVIAVHVANVLARESTSPFRDVLDLAQLESLGFATRVAVWKERCLDEAALD